MKENIEERKVIILDIDELLFFKPYVRLLRKSQKRKSTLLNLSRLITNREPRIATTVNLELRPYISSFLQLYSSLFDVLIVSKERSEIVDAILNETRTASLVKG